MTASPGPFRALQRPDGVWIVVAADDHTVAEEQIVDGRRQWAVPDCDDDTHPGRALPDAEAIAEALNAAAQQPQWLTGVLEAVYDAVMTGAPVIA